MRISFDFDEVTKKISNLNVEDSSLLKKGKPIKQNKGNKLVLKGSSLKLTDDMMSLLKVTNGDRLCIRFNPDPVILTPDTANEPSGGNLITKSSTISCKGTTGELLAERGNEFYYSLKSEGYLVLLDKEPEEGKNTDVKATNLDDSDFSIPGIEPGEQIIV